MRDAQFRTVNPGCRQRRAHAALLRVLLRGSANRLVGEVQCRRKTLCFSAPSGLHFPEHLRGGIGLLIETVFHYRFYSQGAGNFAVRFSSHSVGQHKKVQRRDNAKAIFVVRAHATNVSHAATRDLHTCSDSPAELTPVPATPKACACSHASTPQAPREALNP